MRKLITLSIILLLYWPHLAISQTNRTFDSTHHSFKIETLVDTSNVIWGFDFLNENELIFTERNGNLYHYNFKSKKVTSLDNPLKVFSKGQGGLLDVKLFKNEKIYVYLTYSKPTDSGSTTALARGIWSNSKIVDLKDVFVAKAEGKKDIHYGSRIDIDKNNHLYITIGDRNEREKAQDLSVHNGKILRLNLDGSIPQGNPFANTKDALPEIWSFGHRNPQGIDIHPKTNEVWSCEFGPRGGDELNLIAKGNNYGWPVITYGREYWGPKIGKGTQKKGMEQPVEYWVPSISPAGMAFYTGSKFSHWQNDIFLANLSSQHLRRLKLKNKKVIEQEELLSDLNLRVRSVRMGPDENLYISTDDGKIIKISATNPKP